MRHLLDDADEGFRWTGEDGLPRLVDIVYCDEEPQLMRIVAVRRANTKAGLDGVKPMREVGYPVDWGRLRWGVAQDLGKLGGGHGLPRTIRPMTSSKLTATDLQALALVAEMVELETPEMGEFEPKKVVDYHYYTISFTDEQNERQRLDIDISLLNKWMATKPPTWTVKMVSLRTAYKLVKVTI